MVALLVISDIHFDLILEKPGHKNLYGLFMKQLKEFLVKQKVDALLLAGDVSSNRSHVLTFFEHLQGIEIPLVFVPGNHELHLDVKLQIEVAETDPLQQIEYGMIDRGLTGDSYDSMLELREQVASYQAQMLLDKPIKLLDDPRVLIFGNIGWYNYDLPFRDGAISPKILKNKYDHTLYITAMKRLEEDRKKLVLDRLNPQPLIQPFPKQPYLDPNVSFWRNLIKDIQSQLDLLQNEKYQYLLFMSHYIPFSKAIPYKAEWLADNNFEEFAEKNKNAYTWFFPGVEEAIAKAGLKVDYYIFGHRHTPYIQQNCLCNPFISNPYDRENQLRTLQLPYKDDFNAYFQQGLLQLNQK